MNCIHRKDRKYLARKFLLGKECLEESCRQVQVKCCFEKVEKNFVKVQRDDQKITFRHKNRICKIFYEMEMVNVNKDLRTRFELTNNLGH